MCYDISFKTDIELLSEYFPNLIFDDQLAFEFDGTHILGHDYKEHGVIYRNRQDNMLHHKLMEWGIIRHDAMEEPTSEQRKWMLNIRSEKILDDRASYWYTIRNRRCLIPAVGIYEHRKVKGWTKKAPYFVKLKSEKMFFIPGLYAVANLPDVGTGEVIKRWTNGLITRKANDVMKRIHNDGENKWRMPLFLPFEMATKWLDHDLSETDYRSILNYEIPSEDLEYWPVYTIRSNKPRPDMLPKNAPYAWDKLPSLELEAV